MADMHAYDVLAKTGDIVNNVSTTPGSGATVVLYQSNLPGAARRGSRFKMIVLNITSSADSGANGVIFEESDDGGTNWDTLPQTFTYLTASGRVKTYCKISAPEFRVRYTNSAAVLSTWRFSLLGDNYERGNG